MGIEPVYYAAILCLAFLIVIGVSLTAYTASRMRDPNPPVPGPKFREETLNEEAERFYRKWQQVQTEAAKIRTRNLAYRRMKRRVSEGDCAYSQDTLDFLREMGIYINQVGGVFRADELEPEFEPYKPMINMEEVEREVAAFKEAHVNVTSIHQLKAIAARQYHPDKMSSPTQKLYAHEVLARINDWISRKENK